MAFAGLVRSSAFDSGVGRFIWTQTLLVGTTLLSPRLQTYCHRHLLLNDDGSWTVPFELFTDFKSHGLGVSFSSLSKAATRSGALYGRRRLLLTLGQSTVLKLAEPSKESGRLASHSMLYIRYRSCSRCRTSLAVVHVSPVIGTHHFHTRSDFSLSRLSASQLDV